MKINCSWSCTSISSDMSVMSLLLLISSTRHKRKMDILDKKYKFRYFERFVQTDSIWKDISDTP